MISMMSLRNPKRQRVLTLSKLSVTIIVSYERIEIMINAECDVIIHRGIRPA